MDRLLSLLAALTFVVPVLAVAEDPAPPAGAAKPAEAPAAPTQAVEAMVGEVITLPYNRSAAYGPGRVRGPP